MVTAWSPALLHAGTSWGVNVLSSQVQSQESARLWHLEKNSPNIGSLPLIMRLKIISLPFNGNKGPLLDLFYLYMMCNMLPLKKKPQTLNVSVWVLCLGVQRGAGGPDHWFPQGLCREVLKLLFPAGMVRDCGWQKDAHHVHRQSQW